VRLQDRCESRLHSSPSGRNTSRLTAGPLKWRIFTDPFSHPGRWKQNSCPLVLKNGNWNTQDTLLAQSLLHETRMRSIKKQAQRSMVIIPPIPCSYHQKEKEVQIQNR
jgi:hypothetical protein